MSIFLGTDSKKCQCRLKRPANVEHMSMSMVPPNVDPIWSTSVHTLTTSPQSHVSDSMATTPPAMPTIVDLPDIVRHLDIQSHTHRFNTVRTAVKFGRPQRTMWQARCQLPSSQVRETSTHHVTGPLSTALLSSSGDFTVPYTRPPYSRSTRPFLQSRETSTHPPLQETFCEHVHVIFVLTCYSLFVTIFFGSV